MGKEEGTLDCEQHSKIKVNQNTWNNFQLQMNPLDKCLGINVNVVE